MAQFIRSIDDIIGHKYIINYLKNKIKSDKVPNVILFNGNPGLGKTSIAKVLAIAVNGNKESLYANVIDRNESVDCIKLFNMSSIGDDTDSVVAELQSASFSSTKRKVIILDEVHGMTKKAQDAILVNLEYLPEGIYVFMCTTEMSMLRESLISRCVTFNLNNLSYNEIKQVISRKIVDMNLSFDMNKEMVLNLIASWSNNQPRKALNLLESFEPNSRISQQELSAFVATNNIPIIISLVEYLYGSMTKGIEFIETLSITHDLLNSMLEVLKVALGHTSSMVSANDKVTIAKLFNVYDYRNFLYFTIAINSREKVSKRVFTAKFIEHHSSIYNKGNINLEPTHDIVSVMQSDVRTIGDNAIEILKNDASNLSSFERELQQSVSVDALFNLGQAVVDNNGGE